MGKRSSIYQMIDDSIENESIRNHIKEYIRNLLKKNSDLEHLLHDKKVSKGKRNKRNQRFI